MLVEIRDGAAARTAQEGGAEGIVVRESTLRAETDLPLLAYGPPPEAAVAEVRAHPRIESVTVVRLPPAGELPGWLG